MIKTNIINKNNNNFIMLPKVDYCFKEIMKDIYVLKGFLSAILNIVFFSIENKEELDAMYGKNEYIDKACDHIKELSADEKKKLEYDIRFKALSDHNTQIHSSYNRGVKAGIEQGIEQGIQQVTLNKVNIKLLKGKTAAQIADELEESLEYINECIRKIEDNNI